MRPLRSDRAGRKVPQPHPDERETASSRGAVLGFDLNTHRAQEIVRQYAAGAHDHSVVAHPQLLSGMLQEHRVRMYLADLGIEQHFELAAGAGRIDALAVLLLGALERFTAVR